MNTLIRVLAFIGLVSGLFVAFVAFVGLLVATRTLPYVFPLLMLWAVLLAWQIYAILYERIARQQELLDLLGTAVASNVPLGPVLRAYLQDRPGGFIRTVWSTLFFVPEMGYTWFRYGRGSYESRVAELAERLDRGTALAPALRAVPGLVSREAVLAAAVGEVTGRMAAALRRADRDRLATAWLELTPRVLYPLGLMAFVAVILTFHMAVIMPKMVRIFEEFGQPLPGSTMLLVEGWRSLSTVGGAVLTVLPLFATFAVALVVSPGLRWSMPFLGWLFRDELRGRTLRMLGALLESGRPAPEALAVLADANDLPGVVRRALASARAATLRGESLGDALHSAGLVTGAMVPLVRAAERARTLPWTLTELGDYMSTRALRFLRRGSMLVAPLLVVGVGTLVCVVVLGMFMPLIQLIGRLAE
jgi:type II secretory pathway component PulF